MIGIPRSAVDIAMEDDWASDCSDDFDEGHEMEDFHTADPRPVEGSALGVGKASQVLQDRIRENLAKAEAFEKKFPSRELPNIGPKTADRFWILLFQE
jgi:hypothetical protein